jgi:hypothetical protein
MVYIRQMSPYAQNPWGIQHCLYRFTYMRLRNGDNFWFFLTTVGNQEFMVIGFSEEDGIIILLL